MIEAVRHNASMQLAIRHNASMQLALEMNWQSLRTYQHGEVVILAQTYFTALYMGQWLMRRRRSTWLQIPSGFFRVCSVPVNSSLPVNISNDQK